MLEEVQVSGGGGGGGGVEVARGCASAAVEAVEAVAMWKPSEGGCGETFPPSAVGGSEASLVGGAHPVAPCRSWRGANTDIDGRE